MRGSAVVSARSPIAHESLATEPPDGPLRLSTTIERHGTAVVMHACGEVDAYTLPMWERLLRETAAATTTPGPMIVDTRKLEFMACRAFRVLADQAAVCHRRGIGLALVSTAPIVARIVAAADLSGRLPIRDRLDLALAAASITR